MAENTVAGTEAHGGPVHHEEATLLGLGAEGWVYVGLTIFLLIAIFVMKAPKLIVSALDARIAETVKELDRAKALRAEAEALLASARAKQAESRKEAEAILAHAQREAADLVSDMEKSTADVIARRTKMAEDKIAGAERAAIAEIRSRTVTAASAAAATLIARNHDAAADGAMVDSAIKGLGQAH